jgi:hypothetical protein
MKEKLSAVTLYGFSVLVIASSQTIEHHIFLSQLEIRTAWEMNPFRSHPRINAPASR